MKRLFLYAALLVSVSACNSTKHATDTGNTMNTAQPASVPSTTPVAKPVEQPAGMQKANERLEVK